MFFRSSAYLVLLAFSLVALLLSAFVVVERGWLDAALGTGTQAALDTRLQSLGAFYGRHKSLMDFILATIGLSVSSVLGILSFFRFWYYAERNLPERLQELVDRLSASHLGDGRDLVLASYSTRNLSGETYEADSPTLYERAAGYFGYDRKSRAIAALKRDAEEIDQFAPVMKANLAYCNSVRVSAFILDALQLSFASNQSHDGSNAATLRRALALSERALQMDPTDLDALELAAKLASAAGDEKSTMAWLAKMEHAAAASNRPVRRARALRLQAECISMRTTIAARKIARTKLELARNSLLENDERATSKELNLERGLVWEQLSGLLLLTGRLPSASLAIQNSHSAFKAVGGREYLAAQARLENLRRRLNEANLEKDNDAKALSAGLKLPTHINPHPAEVRVTPAGSVAFRLQPYTPFRVTSPLDQWVSITLMDGKQGYVTQQDVQRLNT